jgi:hypothetical protein
MRAVTATYRPLLPHTHNMLTRVESWYAGARLVTSVPITRGSIAFDATGVIQRQLKITVPIATPERRWDPAGQPNHPLANYGQRLKVYTGIGYPNGATELLDAGWYLITKWEHREQDAILSVDAVDLAQLLVDDRLTVPWAPPPGATFTSELTRLVAGILPVKIPAGFPDRAMSRTVVWPRERDKAITELCDAWPARWWVDDTGAVTVSAPWGIVSDATAPNIVLTDGATGTVTARARQGERGALANVAVVDGKTFDDNTAAPHAEASITSAGSPIRAAGPYGRVTRFYASDLITTQAQAQAVADANLTTYATAGRAEGFAAVPDPAVQLGDVARIYTRDGNAFTGRLIAIDLPLTPANAPMSGTIAMLPAAITTGRTSPKGGL